MTESDDGLADAKRLVLDRIRREIADPKVADAMERVPRERFIPPASREVAYEDVPQPIGEGQTISQPYIVAMMVAALEIRRGDKVLEVGTGSGYQAAILAELATRVITVERIAPLAEAARGRLTELGYTSVRVELAEERLGWPREAPYDGIVVAAAAPSLPRELMDQLEVGGTLIIPVGGTRSQELMKVTRSAESFGIATLGTCRFVPLIGDGAWPVEGANNGHDAE